MRIASFFFCFWISILTGAHPLYAQSEYNQAYATTTTLHLDNKLDNKEVPKSNSFQDSDPVFEFSLRKDLPILAGSGVMTVAGMYLMAQVDPLTEAQLLTLDPEDVNAFDRGATRQYRYQDANLSDHLLTLSVLTPFSVLASRSVRREFAPIIIMYFETAALAGGMTSISKGLFKRKRPYAYNPNAEMSDRLSVGARHSYFSGHVSTSAAFCFLTASMVEKYADRPAVRWAAWSGAVIIPGTIGYWRYTAGKHFPTDIITGYLVGAGAGILIPYLHRAQLPDDVTLNIQPLPYGASMTLTF